jgi:hypothetical protein
MTEGKKIDVGGGRQAVLKPELEERPELGPIIAIVRIAAPWWPGAARRKTVRFLDALVAAFRIRARDEPELKVTAGGSRVVVRRELPGGRAEVRFERDGRGRAVLYCDRRELDNLHALGLLARAKVILPDAEKPGGNKTRDNAGNNRQRGGG